MFKLVDIVEPAVIVVSLCIGCMAVYSVGHGAQNTNDFRLTIIRKISVNTNNRIVLNADVSNFSAVPVKKASVTVDIYDGEDRIIGTGKYVFPQGVKIDAGDTLSFSVEIPVPEKYSAMKRLMASPHSERGTGKTMAVIYAR